VGQVLSCGNPLFDRFDLSDIILIIKKESFRYQRPRELFYKRNLLKATPQERVRKGSAPANHHSRKKRTGYLIKLF
jgi:hypothetical protein